MGLFDNVEKGIEKAVRGAFSLGSKTLQPVEMASALRRELDDKAMTLDAGRTLAPNVFSIELGDADFERARSWGVTLAEELCDVVINHSRSQGYVLQGPVRVSFNHHEALRPGQFEVHSSTERENGAPAQNQQAQAPLFPPARPRQSPGAAQAPNVAQASPTQPAPVYKRQPAPSSAAVEGQPVLDIDGQRYSLNAPSIILGRSSEADILIDDTGVSRKHLEIRTLGGETTAVDLGSTNGSYVDGHRVQGTAALHDGSSITMGRTQITFRILPAHGGGLR
ncbi:FhaA domain-containing protein [Arthrobacter sp. LAPM80]|uniref:FhaA domain-containing protein n=1 Tax=Arthrobacter sp. LAPM80 TaxID=3141788 RepID=UPI00398ADF20